MTEFKKITVREAFAGGNGNPIKILYTTLTHCGTCGHWYRSLVKDLNYKGDLDGFMSKYYDEENPIYFKSLTLDSQVTPIQIESNEYIEGDYYIYTKSEEHGWACPICRRIINHHGDDLFAIGGGGDDND